MFGSCAVTASEKNIFFFFQHVTALLQELANGEASAIMENVSSVPLGPLQREASDLIVHERHRKSVAATVSKVFSSQANHIQAKRCPACGLAQQVVSK